MGDSASSKPPAPVSLRLTPAAVAALDALTTAAGGKVPRHRLAVAALEHGARALAADPRAARGAWLRLAEALAAAALGGIGAELDGPPDNPIAYDITEALLEAARLSVIVAARENRRAAPAA